MARGYELYVDGVRVFHSDSAFDVMIEADGFVDETGMAVGSYTYEEGEYLGWAINQGDTTPDFVVGDEIAVGAIINIYSIPATSGGSMYIGNSTISKMYIGNNEVEKVYLGQDLVYEKQASLPTFDIINNYTGTQTYQFENGMSFGQWCNSAYNTDGYYANAQDYIVLNDYSELRYAHLSTQKVVKQDSIEENHTYWLKIEN